MLLNIWGNLLQKNITLVFLIYTVFFYTCWQRQQHDITRPLVPHYSFSGQTIDMDTGRILPGISIQIRQVKMLYDVTFGTQTVETDSNGLFTFDPIYPGTYYISYKAYNYWLDAYDKLVIAHKDSSVLIKIPKIFFCYTFSPLPSSGHPAIAGNGSKLICNERWFGASIGKYPFVNTDLIRKYKFNTNHWEFENFYYSPFVNRNLTSLTFYRDAVIACVSPDSLYSLSFIDYMVNKKYKLSQNAKGLCLNISDGHIYSCSQNHINKHDKNDYSVIIDQSMIDANNLRALAYYRGLYSYDNDRYILRKHDKDMNILESYVLIKKDTKMQIKKIYDMTFNGYGELWVTLPGY